MNTDALKIDFNRLLPYVIDAFTKVYGKEYCETISERLNRTLIIQYHDAEGIDDYISHIKSCKEREYSIKFLERIGIDVQKYKKDNYTEPLDVEITRVLRNYIIGFKNDYSSTGLPLRAFKDDIDISAKSLMKNKLKLINYLRGNQEEQITEDNFESFTKTEEYLKLIERINELNTIYDSLLAEYRKWEQQFLPYKKYYEFEKNRKKDIFQKKKNELYTEIFSNLPVAVRNSIAKKSVDEQEEAIFGFSDISFKFKVEWFSHEKMNKLKSNDISLLDKYYIVCQQTNYLRNLGIEIPDDKMLECDTEEDVENYLQFLSQNEIRNLLPSDELINYITNTREKKYEEALREYYTTREDFSDVVNYFNSDPYATEYIYDIT